MEQVKSPLITWSYMMFLLVGCTGLIPIGELTNRSGILYSIEEKCMILVAMEIEL